MGVLPKYQLKQLFEAGDLMTEVTLNDFIDSAYNPVLVAGADIQLTKVTTPSGDTITISSTGGGGASVIEGPGIDITTVGSDEKISLNLDTSQTNLIINGSDQLTFAGVHIKDEGLAVGTYRTINFIGDDVLAEDSGTPNKVNVYIPTPTFASHFNTTDGTTNGEVAESGITRSTVRISSPTTEGTPFATGGWAGTNQHAYASPVDGAVSFSTAQQVTGFSPDATGNATITITVYDADGTTALETYTTPVLYQADNHTSVGGRITVDISNYATDTSKRKAEVGISVTIADVFSNAGRSGGRYFVEAVMNTDTVTDGGGTYTYTQIDVFFDTNPFTPVINGNVSIAESTNSALILTKHLSGIEYYIENSKFEIDVTDIDNLNENTQGRSSTASWNFRATGTDYGLSNLQLTAWSPSVGSFPGWSNQYDQQNISFDYDNWNLNTSNYRFRNNDAIIKSKVYDPWGSGVGDVESPNASILIDTYLNRSTSLGEAFADEEERLYRNTTANTYDVWDSTKSLTDGTQGPNGTGSAGTFNNGCIVGSYLVRGSQFFADNGNSAQIGTLIPNLSSYKPDKNGSNPNYSSLSDIPVYHRKFYTSSGRTISNVDLDFTGSFGTSGNATTALANSQMKIYIRRVATNDSGSTGFNANPLAVHGGLYESGLPANGFNDGASGIDTVGSLIRTGSSVSNSVNFTFGENTTLCDNGFWVEIQLVDSDIKLNTLNVTLKFSDGGANESSPALTPN